jgi:hypothetical protein
MSATMMRLSAAGAHAHDEETMTTAVTVQGSVR